MCVYHVRTSVCACVCSCAGAALPHAPSVGAVGASTGADAVGEGGAGSLAPSTPDSGGEGGGGGALLDIVVSQRDRFRQRVLQLEEEKGGWGWGAGILKWVGVWEGWQRGWGWPRRGRPPSPLPHLDPPFPPLPPQRLPAFFMAAGMPAPLCTQGCGCRLSPPSANPYPMHPCWASGCGLRVQARWRRSCHGHSMRWTGCGQTTWPCTRRLVCVEGRRQRRRGCMYVGVCWMLHDRNTGRVVEWRNWRNA